MPKQQNLALELDQLVQQDPALLSRTPSPSSPGSMLELPNVPSYPRLPPIGLSKQSSGLSNPSFLSEENPDLPSTRPSESSRLSTHPAFNVEDVDSEGELGGGPSYLPQVVTPHKPNLKTLTVPGMNMVSRSKSEDNEKRLYSEEDNDEEECERTIRAWRSQSSLVSADESTKERPTSALSQTSAIVTERLQELVKLFKERTERVKEKLVDPDDSDDESPSGSPSKKPAENPPPEEEKKDEALGPSDKELEEHYYERVCCKGKLPLCSRKVMKYRLPESIDPFTRHVCVSKTSSEKLKGIYLKS